MNAKLVLRVVLYPIIVIALAWFLYCYRPGEAARERQGRAAQPPAGAPATPKPSGADKPEPPAEGTR